MFREGELETKRKRGVTYKNYLQKVLERLDPCRDTSLCSLSPISFPPPSQADLLETAGDPVCPCFGALRRSWSCRARAPPCLFPSQQELLALRAAVGVWGREGSHILALVAMHSMKPTLMACPCASTMIPL